VSNKTVLKYLFVILCVGIIGLCVRVTKPPTPPQVVMIGTMRPTSVILYPTSTSKPQALQLIEHGNGLLQITNCKVTVISNGSIYPPSVLVDGKYHIYIKPLYGGPTATYNIRIISGFRGLPHSSKPGLKKRPGYFYDDFAYPTTCVELFRVKLELVPPDV
jgi:hypothetical protein